MNHIRGFDPPKKPALWLYKRSTKKKLSESKRAEWSRHTDKTLCPCLSPTVISTARFAQVNSSTILVSYVQTCDERLARVLRAQMVRIPCDSMRCIYTQVPVR